MHYKALVSDILKSIRQPHSQNEISKKMGFSFNQVYRWESGRKMLSWKEFDQYCKACGVSLESALAKWLNYNGPVEDIHNVLKTLSAGQTSKAMAAALSVSEARFSRWLNGQVSPPVSAIFEIFDKNTSIFFGFIAALANPEDLDGFYESWSDYQDTAEKLCRFHFCHILSLYFVSDRYKEMEVHDDNLIIRDLATDSETYYKALEILEEAKIIEKINGRYRDNLPFRIDTGVNDRKLTFEKLQYFLEKQIEMIECIKNRPPTSYKQINAHLAFTTDEDGFDEIIELSKKYYQNVLKVVHRNDGDPERVADHLILMSLSMNNVLEVFGQDTNERAEENLPPV